MASTSLGKDPSRYQYGKEINEDFIEGSSSSDSEDDSTSDSESSTSSGSESEEEVTRRANDTALGLASYVFTKNSDRLWRMLENLEAGMIGLVSHEQPFSELQPALRNP